MAEEVGVGYVRLVPSMRGFARAAERELKRSLRGPSRKAGEDAGDDVGDGVERRLRDRMGRAGVRIMKGFGKSLRAAAKPVAATAGAAFAAQLLATMAAALASGVVKVVHGLGAVAALLPAAALAGVAAFAALKIAVSGVGDALSAGLTGDTEAFDEALKGLTPSARSFAREVVGLKDGLDSLKASVQESFFEPLVGQIRPLAENYLPVTQMLLAGIGRDFGQAGARASGFLAQTPQVEALTGAFGNVGAALQNVIRPLGRLPEILLPLITVGSTFLPQLTAGFGSATNRLAMFMAEAERTGRLRAWIQGGLDAIRSLVDTGRQVGRIFADIGAIGSAVWATMGIESGSLLDTIERLTGRVREFVESARGSSVLTQVFGVVGEVLSGVRDNIARIAGTVGRVFGPIMPQIGDFIAALVNLKAAVLDTGLDALEPVLSGIATVLGSVLLPALTGLANWLADNRPILQGIGIAILTFLIPAFVSWAISAGAAAIATLLAMAPLILIGAAIAALAALVIIHFDTILSVIRGAFDWVVNNWQLLLTILTGPFGAAVWIITSHKDKIVDAIEGAIDWVKRNWPTLLAVLTGPIGLAVLAIVRHWQTIKDTFNGVKLFIRNKAMDIVNFFATMPGRISRAASGMFNGIKEAFRQAINVVIRWWNGISFTLPTIEIPGFDPPGPGPSFGGATIGGGTFSTPNIPTLHSGGIFDSGRGEGLALLQDGEGVFTRQQMASMAPASSAPAPGRMGLDINITGGTDDLRRAFAKWIRANAGGDVQIAFGSV